MLLVALALLGLGAIPAYPQTETTSLKLRPTEVEKARKLLGESTAATHPDLGPDATQQGSSGGDEASDSTITISVPKLGLEDVPVPSGDSQVELDREGIIRFKDSGLPWEKGSNTFIVGHALGYLYTRTSYVFYELNQLKPGDEIVVKDRDLNEYTFKVYDRITVRPEDFWVTYPVSDKTTISLQTCTPIPTFENRLIVRGELVS